MQNRKAEVVFLPGILQAEEYYSQKHINYTI
jgi:hypothetical protein